MNPIRPSLLLLSTLLLGAPVLASEAPAPARNVGRDVAPYVSADPEAPPVTASNLVANDRFWPFHVAPVVDWTPPGGSEPLRRVPAVLVRVNPEGTVRLDFGRFGRHELPVEATDVVERANQVRLGRIEKMAPNLVLTIGNKMLASRGERVRNHIVDRDTQLEAFLCVFGDVAEEDFAPIAETLRSYEGRDDVLTVVFPQGEIKDSSVRRRLRALDWEVPFVIHRFTRAYRRSIAGEATPLPHVMLLSPDGRVLHRGAFGPETLARVDAALQALPLRGQASQPQLSEGPGGEAD